MVNHASAKNPTSVQLFVEGGGQSREEQRQIRDGFATLIGKVLGDGRAKPRVIASGGRDQTFRAWDRALRMNPDVFSLLLVDSEDPVPEGIDPWDLMSKRAGDTHWKKPPNINDERLFFMVQTMEAWFMADKDALVSFYDSHGSTQFRANALPTRADVENIPKQDLEKSLEHASRETKKGPYRKSHGFAMIGLVDPAKVRAASPLAARFFDKLLAVCPPR